MKRWHAVLIALNLRDLPLVDDETVYPPFSNRSKCPKCNSDGVRRGETGHSSTFMRACTEVVGALRISRPERMRRYCRDCGAYWFELPADADTAAS